MPETTAATTSEESWGSDSSLGVPTSPKGGDITDLCQEQLESVKLWWETGSTHIQLAAQKAGAAVLARTVLESGGIFWQHLDWGKRRAMTSHD